MVDKSKLEDGIDVAIAVLTKSTVLGAVAEVAAMGIIALFRKHGVAVPEIPQAELTAAMQDAATHVVTHAQDLKAKIRAEFDLPPAA